MNTFKVDDDKKLYYFHSEAWLPVKMEPCFPLSHPDKFFSLRTEKDKEVHLFETISEFSKADQKILRSYLKFKNFEFEVTGIYGIDEDFGVRNFRVQTSLGDRNFQTELDEWPEKADDGVISISDLYGERFVINHLEFGEKLLLAYI